MALVHQKEEVEAERKVAGLRTLVEQGYLFFFVVGGCSKEEGEWARDERSDERDVASN